MWDLNKYKPTEKSVNFLIFPCVEINYELKPDFCNDLKVGFF